MSNKTIVLIILVAMLILLSGCLEERVVLTELSENFAIALPEGLVKITGEEEELKDIIANFISEEDEVLCCGILPQNKGTTSYQNSTLLIFERMKEEAATTGVKNIGKYSDTLEFAEGLDTWYENIDLEGTRIFVVDVIEGKDGVPIFILHAQNEQGVSLIAETYSTDYSNTIIACFIDEDLKIVEPTQGQYDEFVSMLKTVTVK